MKKPKAIALFSGGLDSILAAKLMLEQGVEIYALTIITPFSGFSKLGANIPAREFARKLQIPTKIEFIGNNFVELVRHPIHGYGKNMNPCIDCRIMFMQKAKSLMEQLGADFIVTGEVIGERPMTQNRKTLMLIEKQSGLEGLVVRPLSGKLLAPTIPEQRGLIEREKLLAFEGRSRKPQMQLAKEFGIEDYPTPAGGCLLTDPVFSEKLDDTLRHGEDSSRDIAMLRIGRHFRLLSGTRVIVGRNEADNMKLLASQTESSLCFDVHGIPSPIAILRIQKHENDIAEAAAICLRYSDTESDEGNVDYWRSGGEKKTIFVKKIDNSQLDILRI
jgi:tRNA-specific 2-thiouridylase